MVPLPPEPARPPGAAGPLSLAVARREAQAACGRRHAGAARRASGPRCRPFPRVSTAADTLSQTLPVPENVLEQPQDWSDPPGCDPDGAGSPPPRRRLPQGGWCPCPEHAALGSPGGRDRLSGKTWARRVRAGHAGRGDARPARLTQPEPPPEVGQQTALGWGPTGRSSREQLCPGPWQPPGPVQDRGERRCGAPSAGHCSPQSEVAHMAVCPNAHPGSRGAPGRRPTGRRTHFPGLLCELQAHSGRAVWMETSDSDDPCACLRCVIRPEFHVATKRELLRVQSN